MVLPSPLHSLNPTKSPGDGLLFISVLQMTKPRQKEVLVIAESMLHLPPACHGVPALANPEGTHLAVLADAVHSILVTAELHGADLPAVGLPAHGTLVLLHV